MQITMYNIRIHNNTNKTCKTRKDMKLQITQMLFSNMLTLYQLNFSTKMFLYYLLTPTC